MPAIANANSTPVSTWKAALGYLAALIAVAVATGLAIAVDREIQAPNLSLIFVLPVVFAAATFGWGPSLLAAVGGALAYNFFLIAPRYTFAVEDVANIWALVLLISVAAAVSAMAAQSRRRAILALEAAAQAQALNALARSLVAQTDRAGLASCAAEVLSRLLHAPAVVFVGPAEELEAFGDPGAASLTAADAEAARWSLASRLATRGGAYPVGEASFDFWPVITPQRQEAVIGARLSDRDAVRPENTDDLVATVAGYLSVALDRDAYAAQAVEGQVQVARERVKSDLLAAVSHDLKTPLSTILLTLQSLRTFDAGHDGETRAQLLAAAETETLRLTRMVSDLLDMNRLEAGALAVQRSTIELSAVVSAALERAGSVLQDHQVVRIDRVAPRVLIDAKLFETALANVLENAGKYAPAGTTITVCVDGDDQQAWVEVLDEGPGFAGPAEPLFEKFARGREGDGRPPGVGLGLSLAKGLLEAQGARIQAADRGDRTGARVRVSAPLARAA